MRGSFRSHGLSDVRKSACTPEREVVPPSKLASRRVKGHRTDFVRLIRGSANQPLEP